MEEVIYKDFKFAVYNDRDHFISSIIKSGGIWEEAQLTYIIDNIADKSKNMIDVGGDIGSYSILLSHYFNEIYCFEPNRDNFCMIGHSVNANNITNVAVINAACSDERGSCSMTAPHENQILKSEDGEIVVMALDNVVLGDVHFMKIDVEGHEFSVLKGAKGIIERCSPTIYLETHPTIVADSKDNCEAFLKEMGYVELVIFSDYDKLWSKT